MPLSARQLNRATLGRQLLLRREPLGVLDGVRQVVALQAQEPASPYIALWNRLEDFLAPRLDEAFADHAVVKATLMRITLHAVAAEDYPVFQKAMVLRLRGSRLGDRRFIGTGLSVADADALVPQVLEFLAEPRTNAELRAMIDGLIGERPDPGAWWALRTFAPVVHAPVGGPWSYGPRPAYVAARGEPHRHDPDAAVAGIVRRYLEGFGPASAADIAQFTLLTRPVIRAALGTLELERVDGPGGELLDVPGGALPAEDTPAPPRLMAMWDSTLLAYADRSRLIPPDYRPLVIRRNGDVLPTLLVDGYVAGVWRPTSDGIEATAFHPLPADVWRALTDEARGLTAFLADRDPTVYRRYAHWWTTLPAADVRIL